MFYVVETVLSSAQICVQVVNVRSPSHCVLVREQQRRFVLAREQQLPGHAAAYLCIQIS